MFTEVIPIKLSFISTVVNMEKLLDSDVKRNTKTKMKLLNVYGEAGILIIRRLESQII